MKNIYIIIITAFITFACNKSEDNSTPTNTTPTPKATKSELITAAVWKYSAWTANPPVKDSLGNDVSDVYNFKPACERDDLLRFKTNGNLEFDQGPTKCDANADQITTGVWFFNSTETTVSIGGGVYALDMLTADTMKISFNATDNVTHHHIITFVH
jgi:hypothetical protein